MKAKSPEFSKTIMTEIVLPNDTNTLGNLRGGRILHWMDIASAICAGKHAGKTVVTAAVDNVSFENPIHLGDVLTITATVTRAFSTSMEIFIEVWAENIPTAHKYKCNEAFYTFVALNDKRKPIKVPALKPVTKIEKLRFEKALRRREFRLILAGRMKPQNAEELKALFS